MGVRFMVGLVLSLFLFAGLSFDIMLGPIYIGFSFKGLCEVLFGPIEVVQEDKTEE